MSLVLAGYNIRSFKVFWFRNCIMEINYSVLLAIKGKTWLHGVSIMLLPRDDRLISRRFENKILQLLFLNQLSMKI